MLEPKLVYVGFVVDDVLLLLVAHTFLTVFQDFAGEQYNPVNILIACVSDKVNIYFWLILHPWVIFSLQVVTDTLVITVILLICALVSYARVPNSCCSQHHLCNKRLISILGHILRRNCLLKRVIEGKIKGEMEVTRRRGRRRGKLLDDLKDRRGYSHLKEEALDRTMWRHHFRRGFGPVVRPNTEWNEPTLFINFTEGLQLWMWNCASIPGYHVVSLFPKMSPLALGPTKPHRELHPRVPNRLGREVNNCLLFSADVRNAWNGNSIPPHSSMQWTGTNSLVINLRIWSIVF
jgi:hypothetical protein